MLAPTPLSCCMHSLQAPTSSCMQCTAACCSPNREHGRSRVNLQLASVFGCTAAVLVCFVFTRLQQDSTVQLTDPLLILIAHRFSPLLSSLLLHNYRRRGVSFRLGHLTTQEAAPSCGQVGHCRQSVSSIVRPLQSEVHFDCVAAPWRAVPSNRVRRSRDSVRWHALSPFRSKRPSRLRVSLFQ